MGFVLRGFEMIKAGGRNAEVGLFGVKLTKKTLQTVEVHRRGDPSRHADLRGVIGSTTGSPTMHTHLSAADPPEWLDAAASTPLGPCLETGNKMFVVFDDESGNYYRSTVFAMAGLLMCHVSSYHFGNERWMALMS